MNHLPFSTNNYFFNENCLENHTRKSPHYFHVIVNDVLFHLSVKNHYYFFNFTGFINRFMYETKFTLSKHKILTTQSIFAHSNDSSNIVLVNEQNLNSNNIYENYFIKLLNAAYLWSRAQLITNFPPLDWNSP